VVVSFRCNVLRQSNIVHERKSTAIYRMCRQLVLCVLLLGPATIKARVYACDFHHWHFLDTSNPEPYLCMVFDCGLCMAQVSLHGPNKTGVSSTARWLCMHAPFSISDCGNHFLVVACSMQYHCNAGLRMSCHRVDVTLSHSKSQWHVFCL